MVEVKNLSYAYRGKPLILDSLNLGLNKGHIYGLLGKNGAGKSTLLKNITGLAFPLEGACFVNDTDVSGRPVSVLEDVYFLPEELYVPSLTPSKFVSNTAGFYPRFNRSDFFKYLRSFEIDTDGIMDKQSFGQQKKTMIAFGLATNTSLVIMDEPTNGLDIPSKVQFRKLIASVLTDDRCILISTHQVRDLESLIDTLLILNDRKIILNTSLDQIAEKLFFGLYPSVTSQQTLYEEETFRGKNVILENTSGQFSKIDLELLFNALTTGNQSILNLLNAH